MQFKSGKYKGMGSLLLVLVLEDIVIYYQQNVRIISWKQHVGVSWTMVSWFILRFASSLETIDPVPGGNNIGHGGSCNNLDSKTWVWGCKFVMIYNFVLVLN